jgi:hypothetical protein
MTDVAAVAVAPATITQRAEALLAPLRRVHAFDAAHIALLDPERRVQPPVVRRGYPTRFGEYLDSSAMVDDLEMFGLHRDRGPMRAVDSPVPLGDLPVWTEWTQPAGFGEAVGVPLHTADGRYLGVLGMHTNTSTPASEAVCDRLAALAPLIAHAVDPMRSIAALACLVTEAAAGVVLTRGGDTRRLGGLRTHRLLVPGSPLLIEAANRHAAGDAHATFLAPDNCSYGPRSYQKVTMLRCPKQPPYHLTTIVLLSRPLDLVGLTHQELIVLGALIQGWDHGRIVATVGMSRQAIIEAVEKARLKLGAPTRDSALIRSADRGLYIPPALIHPTMTPDDAAHTGPDGTP